MAQEIIAVGASGDDGTGDTFRESFVKTNSNFTELFERVNAGGIIFVAQESDFPVQDATTITLESGVFYWVTASITTAKRFIIENNALLTAGAQLTNTVLTYTGTGSMFTATDATFTLRSLTINHPNAQGFNINDTVGGVVFAFLELVLITSGAKMGTFNNLGALVVNRCSFITVDGISMTGTSFNIFSVALSLFRTTSASAINIDLNSAVYRTFELENVIFDGITGSVGISGLVSSGNVATGRLATVANCDFDEDITPLANITSSDIRWSFRDNNAISDTIIDAMLSLTGNAVETVISVAGTPVLVEGVWTVERASLFTGTVDGRVTYNGERDTVLPVDITVTIVSASGTNKDITVFLAVNGTAVPNSAKSNRVGSSDPKNTSVLWQLSMAENDYLEVFVANDSDTIGLGFVERHLFRG